MPIAEEIVCRDFEEEKIVFLLTNLKQCIVGKKGMLERNFDTIQLQPIEYCVRALFARIQ